MPSTAASGVGFEPAPIQELALAGWRGCGGVGRERRGFAGKSGLAPAWDGS